VLDHADPQGGPVGRSCPGQGIWSAEAGNFNHVCYSSETMVTK
jgi:hypothetical protein